MYDAVMPESERRALLLGVPAPDLRGVEHDIELMHVALLHHHFSAGNITTVVGASRDEIASALHDLAEATRAGDVVAIYYSGHGAKSGTGASASEQFPFLVPSDFEASSEDDFRGYTNLELSLVLDALTRKTPNVTVIMDCCHAGRMFRAGEDAQPERIVWQDISRDQPTRNLSLTGRWRLAAERHFQRLVSERRGELALRHAEANPFVVQLLASSDGGRAYETTCSSLSGCSHRFAGAMTLALHEQLLGADRDQASLTWQDIGRALRLGPRRHDADQRVAVEGPFRRLIFSLDEREESGAIDVECSNGKITLVGGRLLGLEVGDRFALVNPPMRGGSQEFVAQARVSEVSHTHAVVTTSVAPERLRRGASALALSHERARVAVEIVGSEPDSPEYRLLRGRVEASGLVRVRTTADELPLAARLEIERGTVLLRHRDAVLDRPRRFDLDADPREARRLAAHLERSVHGLARQVLMDRLADTPGGLSPDWSISWSTVEDGTLGPALSMTGAQLRVGQRFTIVCSDMKVQRWLSVFLLRDDGAIEMLSRSQGDGVEVGPASPYMLGQRSGVGVGSVELRHAASTILIFVTDHPVPLRHWEQPAIRRFDPFLDPLQPPSVTRNISPPTLPARVSGYHIHRIRFHTCNAER
jgi:hypothetical protein